MAALNGMEYAKHTPMVPVNGASNGYSERPMFMSESNGENMELPPLSDVVTAHVTHCLICQENMKKKPVPNILPPVAQYKIACSSLQAIFQRYADYEGRVNNIVAYDEYGNRAG